MPGFFVITYDIMKLPRNVIFFVSLSLFIFVVNNGFLSRLLNNVMGIPWCDPLIIFLKQNTQGFVLLLIYTIYTDYIHYGKNKPLTMHSDDLTNLLNIAEKYVASSNGVKELFQKLLVNKYGNYHPESLTNYILQNKQHYTNVVVRNTLTDSASNSEKFDWEYDIWLDLHDKKFIIAATTSAFLQDIVSKTCPQINDVLTIPSIREGTYEELKDVGEQLYVSQFKKTDAGTTQETKCKVEIASATRRRLILKNIPKEYHPKIVIFYCPSRKQ